MISSFKLKLFLSFIAYGVLLVFSTQFAVFKIDESNIKETSIKNAKAQYLHSNNMFKTYIKDMNLRLLSIKNSQILEDNFIYDKDSKIIDSLFLDIANTSDSIMQLRYLNNAGIEKIRIERDNYASKPYILEKNKLQNKSNRYYFKKSINLKNEDLWYSQLDLNIEHGKVEKPIKPVLRIASPLFHKKRKIGIIVINIFMKEFLKELSSTPNYNIYLVDKDAYFILHPKIENYWSKYLNTTKEKKFFSYFPDDGKNILKNNEYFGKTLYSNRIFLDNNENIKMIVEPKQSYIKEEIYDNFYNLLFILLIVVLISFPISYYLSIPPSKLKEKVDLLNNNLQEIVQHKTKELQELNDQLEEKILQRTNDQNILLSLFDLSDAVLFKWKNNEHWSVEYVSKSVVSLLKYSQEEFQNNIVSYSYCIHHDDIKRVKEELLKAIKKNLYFFTHEPYRVITKDGEIKWILDNTVIVKNDKNQIINFVGYLTDISELKKQELRLKKLSITDQLTKVFNRMYLDENLQKQYYRFNRNNEECSIILIDIDNFKSVNDEYGHLIGDLILVEFASLVSLSIRVSDIIGRWGGEEFLIILPHTNISKAIMFAEKIRKLIEQHSFSIIKNKTASFGVSTLIKGDSIESTIDNADKALYTSKKNGRNRVTSA